ncbi:MAG: glucokinase, partial [Alphaproteobacteria bacterium]
MRILADIGGTYARFAVEESGAPVHIKKYAAADFATFGAALEQYRAECGIKETSELLIATAAHPDEKNIWRFVNKNEWIIDPKVLGNVALILNDFEASTWGLKGVSTRMPSVLIGPGTGLGLGYVIPGANGIHIQGTQGGHLPAAAVTDEQSRVLKAVEKVKQRNGFVVYEDVVSGPGLFN